VRFSKFCRLVKLLNHNNLSYFPLEKEAPSENFFLSFFFSFYFIFILFSLTYTFMIPQDASVYVLLYEFVYFVVVLDSLWSRHFVCKKNRCRWFSRKFTVLRFCIFSSSVSEDVWYSQPTIIQ